LARVLTGSAGDIDKVTRASIETNAAGSAPTAVEHLIIGSGFGGMCAAIRLQQAGKDDFVILERAGSVGGTWRDNHYPGCACDVTSVLYSLSFAQNAEWSRKFPTQQEIYQYLKDVAERFGLIPRIRFHHEVTQCTYENASNRWLVETPKGDFSARFLITASGGLAEPAFPDIPGLDSFSGPMFHSAQWDHSVDLKGKRVAVIGTGASAIQVVPAIAPETKHLTLFQRSPAWVVPRRDRPIFGWEKALRRTPLRWIPRALTYFLSEFGVLFLAVWPGLHKIVEPLALRHLKRQVPDPDLQAKLTPNYRMGCKRILVSDDYYPSLTRENVAVETDRIERITPDGVVSADGRLHEVDVIVLCTGFRATDNPWASRVRGRTGETMEEAWKGSQEAYLGTLVHGFPNLFMIAGPNTGIGHTSFVFMIESQVRYIMACLRHARRSRLDALEVRAEVQDAFNEDLQRRMQGTVWASGCKSWYMNEQGKVTVLWPGFTLLFWWMTRTANPADFAAPAGEPAHAPVEEPMTTVGK